MFDEIKYIGENMYSGMCWFSTNDSRRVHCIDLIMDSYMTYDIAHNLTNEEFSGEFSNLVCCRETFFATLCSRHSPNFTIYRGTITNDKIALSPVFTLTNDMISMCVNEMSILFILLDDCCLAYDFAEKTLERITLSMQLYAYELRPTTEGAVVFNRNKCFCISRLSGHNLTTKYLVKELSFDNDYQGLNMHNRYKFSAGIFFRIPYQNYHEDSQLEFATYDDFMNAVTFSDINWLPLSLPSTGNELYINISDHHFFQMRILKDKLCCDIDCPHCDETSY
jgi:hypothetical protein